MERRRWLSDGFAGAAGELLPHGLDHLVAARDALERLGDRLAELGQPAAAAGAIRRRRDHDALAGQMRRQWRADRLGAGERAHARHRRAFGRSRFVLSGRSLELFQLHLELVKQLAAALGGWTKTIALQLGDQQLEMRHHRLGAGSAGLGFAPCRALGNQRRTQRLGVVRQVLGSGGHVRESSTPRRVAKSLFGADPRPPQPAARGLQVCCGCRQSMPSSM